MGLRIIFPINNKDEYQASPHRRPDQGYGGTIESVCKEYDRKKYE